MKTKITHLPDSELEIMLAVWEGKGEITSEYLSERLDKSWAKGTLLTLLSRLCTRGFLKCEKKNRINVYTPLVSYDSYLKCESMGFLRKFHKKSLTGLVASLDDGDAISQSELIELKKFIEEAEK